MLNIFARKVNLFHGILLFVLVFLTVGFVVLFVAGARYLEWIVSLVLRLISF
jgi:hypothetical protein